MTDNRILEVKGVSKRFGGLEANKNITMDVRRGEILALIGPNGAGKSTLFNLIAGALEPTSGEIFLEGAP
ncbi:MAG: ATP-binding cassette domain-containing protein, partial [Afipia sp.]|nr:ATP-binding cassette domain-containing protein [Afipia sp.]